MAGRERLSGPGEHGREVRNDFTGTPQYPSYERMARNDITVAARTLNRFYPAYPRYDVDMFDGDNRA